MLDVLVTGTYDLQNRMTRLWDKAQGQSLNVQYEPNRPLLGLPGLKLQNYLNNFGKLNSVTSINQANPIGMKRG